MSAADAKAELASNAKVLLSVDAGDPAVEVTVINGVFQRVATDLGRLETLLDPGLYEIEFQAGLLRRQIPVTLWPGQAAVHVPPPELPFSTPLPLPGRLNQDDYHARHAATLSRDTHQALGGNGGLFVFVRDLEVGGDSNPAAGITLHDQAGSLLVDVALNGTQPATDSAASELPCAGCTIRLPAGMYRLRVRTPETTAAEQAGAQAIEQALVVCEGLQTQLFLARSKPDSNAPWPMVDVGAASICMAPLSTGFEPLDPMLRRTELARIGLATGRRVISDDELMHLLTGEIENPMLSLYAAHLLLLRPQPDRGMLRGMVDKLRNRIGEHPDLDALALHLQDDRRLHRFWSPPMLYQSWRLLVEASIRYPEVVPAASLSARIADRAASRGVWLTWFDIGAGPVPIEPLPDLSALVACLPQGIAEMREWDVEARLEKLAEERRLTQLEHALLETVAFMARPNRFIPDELEYAHLVPALGVPSASVDMAAAGLLRKVAPAAIRSRRTRRPAQRLSNDAAPLPYRLTTLVYSALIARLNQLELSMLAAGGTESEDANQAESAGALQAVSIDAVVAHFEAALRALNTSESTPLEDASRLLVDDVRSRLAAAFAPDVSGALDVVLDRILVLSPSWNYRSDIQGWHDVGYALAQTFYAGCPYLQVQQRLTQRADWTIEWTEPVRHAPFGFRHRHWGAMEPTTRPLITLVASPVERFANYLAYPFFFMYEYISHVYPVPSGSEFFTEGWLLYAANAFVLAEKQSLLSRFPIHRKQIAAFEPYVLDALAAPYGLEGYHKARPFRAWLEHERPGYFRSIMYQLAALLDRQPASLLHWLFAQHQLAPGQLLRELDGCKCRVDTLRLRVPVRRRHSAPGWAN